MAHTPGPWEISKSGMDRLIYAESESAFDLAIVRNGGNDNTVDANARLIAAAPDLLEACKSVLSSPIHGDTPSIEALKMVRDAIAKAEGDL